MSDLVRGSCQCRAVTFEVAGAFERFFLCHCSRCRKGTGSAHAANLFSSTAEITWLSGSDLITTYRVPDTRHARSFCSQCGSAVPRQTGKMLLVPAGSLDSDVPIRPTAHIHFESRANWDEALEQVHKFPALPG
jgi:hypothetical protein